MLPGVYIDKKKNGELNYRASITIDKKHISLGSYTSEIQASAAYSLAKKIMEDTSYSCLNYQESSPLKYDKYVSLINLRDNHLYFSNPIYIRRRDFSYFYSPFEELKFDMDDLFYFSQHKIMCRGNHYFVAEYGMQTSIKERFGIRSFSVEGRDFVFVNSDSLDFRRENLKIINHFYGVTEIEKKLKKQYKSTIHVKSNYVIGVYQTEKEAAIAYNKAADTLTKNGFDKEFFQNYVEDLSNKEYAEIYSRLKISDRIINLKPSLK